MKTYRFHTGRDVILLMASFAAGPASPLSAQIPCGYEITAIIQGPFCGAFGFPPTVPVSITEGGDVVGRYNVCTVGPSLPFLWSKDAGFTTLSVPQGFSSGRAEDSDSETGWIVGSMIAEGQNRNTAAVWINGAPTDLGTVPGGNHSQASAISAARIVGMWGNDITGDPALQGFVWQDGEMIDLGPSLGTAQGVARDVNTSGQIVGGMGNSLLFNSHAFLWQDGVVEDLGVIPGGFTAEGVAINDATPVQIVGAGAIPAKGFTFGLTRAFFWEDGQMINLGTLPGLLRSACLDINDAGLVVGTAWGPGQHGIVWYDGVMVDLNDLIPPEAGVNVNFAWGINNSGQIACRAQVVDNNDVIGLLLTPINSPPGDLNCDGIVGIADFLQLLGDWGACPPQGSCPADLNGDGFVGINDFLILLANWS